MLPSFKVSVYGVETPSITWLELYGLKPLLFTKLKLVSLMGKEDELPFELLAVTVTTYIKLGSKLYSIQLSSFAPPVMQVETLLPETASTLYLNAPSEAVHETLKAPGIGVIKIFFGVLGGVTLCTGGGGGVGLAQVGILATAIPDWLSQLNSSLITGLANALEYEVPKYITGCSFVSIVIFLVDTLPSSPQSFLGVLILSAVPAITTAGLL